MYLRRHCYDKPHRCPGWAGGGRKFPRHEPTRWWHKRTRCEGGHLDIDYEDRWYKFRWHRCNNCDVRAIPIIIKNFDPMWILKWEIPYRMRGWEDDIVARWEWWYDHITQPRMERQRRRWNRRYAYVDHVPQWEPADLRINAEGDTRPGWECTHELENGNGQCGSNTFDNTIDDPHTCIVKR